MDYLELSVRVLFIVQWVGVARAKARMQIKSTAELSLFLRSNKQLFRRLNINNLFYPFVLGIQTK